MNRWNLAVFLFVVVCAAALLVTARRLAAAEAGRSAAAAALTAVARDAQEILDLRARPERIALAERPSQDTLARLSEALAQAGLPAALLKDLARDADSAPAIRGSRRQSARFTLEPVTVAQLGEFLDRWRSGQQLWSVNRIDLVHVGSPNEPVGTYAARLGITALVVESRSTAETSGARP